MMRIATVLGTYLPGYKAGGPIRAIANMVEHLGDEFEFLILTADRDLGDQEPYPHIKTGEWQPVGKAQVCYLPPADMRLPAWMQVLQGTTYDLCYLNGFFSPSTIATLLLRKLNQLPACPIIVTPRGEFNRGALSLKPLKKSIYLAAAKWIGLYQDVLWHATNRAEAHEIQTLFKKDIQSTASCIIVASDLPASGFEAQTLDRSTIKERGIAQIVFLSRIARMKNLDFALSRLAQIRGRVRFDIYGPVEDRSYWDECQRLIGGLPANVEVQYQGILEPDQVIPTVTRYHLFFLPTRGENFGHAILEALIAGCPALISDQTPWRDLADKKAGWDVPLDEPSHFVDALNNLIDMDELTFSQWSQSAREFGRHFAQDEGLVDATRQLFLTAMKGR